MNWFKFYIGDFQRDTGHLTLMERGAYLTLIHHYYATEKPLPVDLNALCRIAGAHTKSEREAVQAVLAFFMRDGDVLLHPRIEAEISKAGHRSEMNRVIAEERERARREARNGTESENESTTNRATNGCTESAPNARDQTPDTRHQKSKPKKPPEPIPAPPDFVDAELWDGFVQMRRASKKPFTALAARLVLNELQRFHERGIDANLSLQKSITNGWLGVFEPKGPYENSSTSRHGGSHKPSLIERVDPRAGEWWDHQLRAAEGGEILEAHDGGLREQVGQPGRREADGIVVEGDFRAVG